jgi:hypothetical protein
MVVCRKEKKKGVWPDSNKQTLLHPSPALTNPWENTIPAQQQARHGHR